EIDFAGSTDLGCLKLRQIIKAALDHCNARIPLRRCSQGTVKRYETAPVATCDGGKVGPCGFRRGAPVARSTRRKQYGRNTRFRAGSSRANKLVRQYPGLRSKGSAR